MCMRVSYWRLLLPLLAMLWLTASAADTEDPADGIVGDWMVESHDAVIRIQRVGPEYQGRIVWQLHDTYGPEDGPELNGKPTTDRNNPDPARRSQPMDGLLLIWGLHYDAGARKWRDGYVYDSDDGHTYHCTIWLKDPEHLRLRGYMGISLFGGSTLWTRVHELPPAGTDRTNSVHS